MNKYAYSAATNMFYPLALVDDYKSAGTWPSDAVEVTDKTVSEFNGTPPAGQRRVVGSNARPAWGDIQPLTREELLSRAEQERSRLLAYADYVIADWRTELMLGEISDADKLKLSEWMAYKRDVKAVKSESAISPDFVWPAVPA